MSAASGALDSLSNTIASFVPSAGDANSASGGNVAVPLVTDSGSGSNNIIQATIPQVKNLFAEIVGDVVNAAVNFFFSLFPVVLDLSGKGINITQESSSNTFFDGVGDGEQHQTAWAGAGNAVLFYDPTATGSLTRADQVVFTDLDPSAANDMQALEDVFDTNHNGSLDSGDASYAGFYLDVTNANGTQTVETLAQAGITSINLTPNAVNQSLPDGSAIQGETTYTTSSGSTGAAATVSFAADSNGYAVASTTTTNADGSTTIDNVASYYQGGVASEHILNTSANGLTKVLTVLNGGGNVETIQTDVTVPNASGSVETLTNYAYGTISTSNHSGELGSSVSTTGAEKLNSTQTTISTSGGTTATTILRDQLGGGWTTQQEVDTSAAGGGSSIVISDLNPDGSASNVTTTNVSANGLTRTVTSLVDGIAADSTVSTDATLLGSNNLPLTETVTGSVGTTTVSTATTQYSNNETTRVTANDETIAGTMTLVSTSTASTTAGTSSSTTIQYDVSANGTLIDDTSTNTSTNGLVVTTQSDTNGAGTVAAPVYDQTEVNSTVYATGNTSRTVTDTVTSANGTLRSLTTNQIFPDGVTRNVAEDNSGDGSNDHTEAVALSNGVTTDTATDFSGNGTMIDETVTVTASGGLSTTTSVDSTGATGTGGAPIFDHVTTDVTVKNADGSSTGTIAQKGSAGALIETGQVVISANGLTTTTSTDLTGANGDADGTFDRVTIDATTVNADNSLSETTTDYDGAGHVLDTTVQTTSADRKTVTTTTTLGTTGLVMSVETVATQSTGATADTAITFDKNGDVLNATVTTASADGLTTTAQDDIQGQSASAYAASGLSFDQTTTDTTVINADGSQTETVNVASNNGTVYSSNVTTTSANGLVVTATANPFNTAHYATQTVDTTAPDANGDGGTTETASDFSYNGTLINQTVTATSANGLSVTTTHDFNGDGTVDQSTTDVTVINADGSQTETVTDHTGGVTGTFRDSTVTTSGVIVAGAGQETTIATTSRGSVAIYSLETILPAANGSVSDTTQFYSYQGGSLLLQTNKTTSANGLAVTTGTAVGGDTTNDFWTTDTTVLNADGSTTETVANSNKTGLISETVTATTANGLWTTTSEDANGALVSGTPSFNLVTTDDTVFNTADGSQTETVTDKSNSGTTISQIVKTTSADQQTVTTNSYLDETGTITKIDRAETGQTQANGSILDTILSYGPTNALLSTITKTTSGNGLVGTTTYKNAAGSTTDTQSDTTTYDANGDGGTLSDFEDADVVGSTTLSASVKTQAVANGQSETTTMTLTGALAAANPALFSVATTISTSIADTGVTTQTSTDAINGASSVNDTTSVVTSANGLSVTTSTSLANAAPYIVQQDVTNLDGSQSDTTTYYDPAALSLVLQQLVVNTSWDGRSDSWTEQSDYDQFNQTIVNNATLDPNDGTSPYTPSYSFAYSNLTGQDFINANGSTTKDITVLSSAFGAPGYFEYITTMTNADGSTTTASTTEHIILIQGQYWTTPAVSQTLTQVSANGMIEAEIYDTTGLETSSNMTAAAAAVMSGSALPSSLLLSDIVASKSTTLNADGSQTQTIQTTYGNSLTNLRAKTIVTTSANGLVVTTKVDNDGNGVYEQTGTSTIAPDGSKTEIFNYYGDTTATNSTLTGSNTYTVSANGLVSTLTTSTGITDTTVDLPDSNGSYQWSRSVTSGSAAYTFGWRSGSASHDVDANGIDTWTSSDGYGDPATTITIDLATEQQDIAIANEISLTILGQPMDDAETQYLNAFITNGILNREQFAYYLAVGSKQYAQEYSQDYGVKSVTGSTSVTLYQAFDVVAAFENALGRLPTAEEMGDFDQYLLAQNAKGIANNFDDIATMAVAVAQYATDEGLSNNRTILDAGADLVTTAPDWINSGGNALQVNSAGTYSYSGSFMVVHGVTATISGNNDAIVETAGSALTVNGSYNSVDIANVTASVTATNTLVTVEAGAIATVNELGNVSQGGYDQIAQIGPSQLILTPAQSGYYNGAYIYVAPGTAAASPNYKYAYSTTNASSSVITFAPGDGSSSTPALVTGNGDSITLNGNDHVNVTSSSLGANMTLEGTDTATLTGSNFLFSMFGTDTVTANGNNNTAIVYGNDTVVMTAASGSPGTVYVDGGNDSITASNTVVSLNTLWSGSPGMSGVTITGTSNTVTLVAGWNVQIVGSGSHVTLSGNDTVSVSATSTVSATGSNNVEIIADTAANVAANLATLNSNTGITSIALSDAGTPNLVLTAAQVAAYTQLLGKIAGSYTITVTDSAANVLANIAALNASTHLTAITLTGSGTQSLALNAAQVAADTVALSKITSAYTIAVSDTAANIGNNIAALNANSHLASITISDSGVIWLTAAQVATDTSALGKITPATYTLYVSDTAANVAANVAVAANTHVSSIVLSGTGTQSMTLTAAQAATYATALNTKVIGNPYTITVSDTAANVLSNITNLNTAPHLATIILTDTTKPTFALSSTQVLSDIATLGLITSAYAITLTNGGTPTFALTNAQLVADMSVLANIVSPYQITVSDTAANVVANIAILNANTHLTGITLTGSGTQTLTMTAAVAAANAVALGKITSAYNITIADTLVNIEANIAALNANSHVTTLTPAATGTPSLSLTPAQFIAKTVSISTAGTYTYSGAYDIIFDWNASSNQGVAATIGGTGEVIVADNGSNITFSGTGDFIDDPNGTDTFSGSSATITVESGSNATIAGNNNQISQAGPTEVTLTSGTGNTINVLPGTAPVTPAYVLPYATTNASNAVIAVGAGAGTLANPDLINGNSNTVKFAGTDNASIAGAANTISLTGNSSQISTSGSGNTVTIQSSTSDNVTLTGTGDIATAAASDNSSVINLQGTNESVTLAGINETAWAYSSNDTITLTGSSDIANCSSYTASGLTLNMAGSSESGGLYGTGGSAYISGTSDYINVLSSGASVSTSSAATATTITLYGATETATENGAGTINLQGTNDTATLAGTGNTAVVAASNNTVTTTKSGETISLNAGTGIAVNASGATINMAQNIGTTINGGSDAFVFQPTFGQDVINGYASTDTFQFSKTDFANWAALLSHTSQSGSDTIITLDAADIVTLKGVTASSLQSSQFKFA